MFSNKKMGIDLFKIIIIIIIIIIMKIIIIIIIIIIIKIKELIDTVWLFL